VSVPSRALLALWLCDSRTHASLALEGFPDRECIFDANKLQGKVRAAFLLRVHLIFIELHT
jgi:hypothetical protein